MFIHCLNYEIDNHEHELFHILSEDIIYEYNIVNNNVINLIFNEKVKSKKRTFFLNSINENVNKFYNVAEIRWNNILNEKNLKRKNMNNSKRIFLT
jgi:hypothetical protein